MRSQSEAVGAVAAPGASGVARFAWLRRAWSPELRLALTLCLALRAAFSLFAFALASIVPLRAPCALSVPAPGLHPTGLGFPLLGVWERYDACFYQRIAAWGYRPGDEGGAFFPLYPLLMRVAGALTGDLTLAGLAVSGIATVAALLGLQRLVARDFGAAVARRATLYLALFPTVVFLFVPYAEALFLALAVWAILCARRGAWGWAAPLALLAGLTRTQGVLLCLPLAWEFLAQWRRPDATPRPGRRAALVPTLPAAAFGAFFIYGRLATGLTIFQAEHAWGGGATTPWTLLAHSWQYIVAHADVIEASNLLAFGLFVALLAIGARRLPLSYTLYAAPQLLVIALREGGRSPLMSTSRFVLVLFPCFVALALLLGEGRRHRAWLLGSAALLTLALTLYVGGSFVG